LAASNGGPFFIDISLKRWQMGMNESNCLGSSQQLTSLLLSCF